MLISDPKVRYDSAPAPPKRTQKKFQDNCLRSPKELTKEEYHDTRQHHRELVRFTHGIGDRNNL